MTMKPRERVFTALEHREPDRVPLFEIWIEDDMVPFFGQTDLQSTYVHLGLDCVPIPFRNPFGSSADGVDAWGRIWKKGQYAEGAIHTEKELLKYSPALNRVKDFFDPYEVDRVQKLYPDYCLIFGSHIAPFTAGYMAMGLERFFIQMVTNPSFVRKLLDDRTEWCMAMFEEAQNYGIDIGILGEDAGHKSGPMVSEEMWREFVFPLHRRIIDELDVPLIWHSDGDFQSFLPVAVEAGFIGIHALEPDVGMDLGIIKQKFGDKLVLVGNVDTQVLFKSDLAAVHREVERCMQQAAPGGGYMFASCNSIFPGMNPAAVREMYRYAAEIGEYKGA
ncbi:MAG: hypothetical protein JXB23_15785 [Candidatus Aminicenantes bacterium]|nr:hypothetical protein [Candidatus Aminicenantes bacterium]